MIKIVQNQKNTQNVNFIKKNITKFSTKAYFQTNELQNKLINHVTKNGKKQKSEKNIAKSFKATQKSQKKNHGKLTKLSILNTIPIFKIVKLTNKKRRKKSVKEIPTLVSNYNSRVSLSLKYLIKTTNSATLSKQKTFLTKFKNELLLGAKSENQAHTIKQNFQTKALTEKKYFRYYRW